MCTMTQHWAGRLAAIKVERESRGMTQAELADAAGVAESTIQNLEGARTYTTEPRTLRVVEAALRREAPDGHQPPSPDGTPTPTPRGSGMPLRVQRELTDGEIVDTDVIDLSVGGMKLIVVVTREAGEAATDENQMRRGLREWSRIQRRLRGIGGGDDGTEPPRSL